MESESVTESLGAHSLSEIVQNTLVTSLNNTSNFINKYYENHVANTTDISTTTMPPGTALLHLSKTFFVIARNTSDNVTIFPQWMDKNATLGKQHDGKPLDHAPQLTESTMIKVYVLAVMAALSFFGNLLTMWNIYKTRIRRRSSRHTWSAIYSLIFHLSIADLLVTGFCIVGEAVWFYTVQWLAGEIACKLVKLFQMFSLYLSTYILVLIGVDRWIAVKYPMKSLNRSKRSYRLIGGTYVISFLLSIPQFFIFHLARGPFVEEFHQCVTHGFYTAHWQEQLYTTFTLIFTFLLPLCILFVTYISTFCTISSSEKMFMGPRQASNSTTNSMQTNRQRIIHKAKMKSLRISVVIIIAFIVCWTPYYVMMITLMFLNPNKRISEGLVSAIFVFGMSNSLVNPVIYGAFHLHPMKRKCSQRNGNAANSLNRADSQRTPSILTAVTQVDGNGRQIRTFRQSSYYRKASSGNNSKEHVNLLQMSAKNAIVHKFNSERGSRIPSYQHIQTTNLNCNELDDGDSESGVGGVGGVGGVADDANHHANSYSPIMYSCKNSKAANMRTQSTESLNIFPSNCLDSTSTQRTPASICLEGYKNKMSTEESVSSV